MAVSGLVQMGGTNGSTIKPQNFTVRSKYLQPACTTGEMDTRAPLPARFLVDGSISINYTNNQIIL